MDADGGKRKGGQGRSESMQNTESRETSRILRTDRLIDLGMSIKNTHNTCFFHACADP